MHHSFGVPLAVMTLLTLLNQAKSIFGITHHGGNTLNRKKTDQKVYATNTTVLITVVSLSLRYIYQIQKTNDKKEQETTFKGKTDMQFKEMC